MNISDFYHIYYTNIYPNVFSILRKKGYKESPTHINMHMHIEKEKGCIQKMVSMEISKYIKEKSPFEAYLRGDPTYVQESTIIGGGMGLFSRERADRGIVVTMYPVDVIIYGDPVEIGLLADVANNSLVTELHSSGGLTPYIITFELNEERYKFVGLPNAQKVFQNAQFANDPCSFIEEIQALEFGDYEKFNHLLMRYYLVDGMQKANTRFKKIGFNIVLEAIRAISEGDEIFVCYGFIYWINSNKSIDKQWTPEMILQMNDVFEDSLSERQKVVMLNAFGKLTDRVIGPTII